MSQYNLQQFVKLWAQERLTVEQAVGQLLLHIRELSERVARVEQQMRLTPDGGPDEITSTEDV